MMSFFSHFFKEQRQCSDPKEISQIYVIILQNLKSKIAFFKNQKRSNMQHGKGSIMCSGAGGRVNLLLGHCLPFFSEKHYGEISREEKNNHWGLTLNDGRHSLMKEKWHNNPRQASGVEATVSVNCAVCVTKRQRLKPTNPMRSITVSGFVSFKYKWII